AAPEAAAAEAPEQPAARAEAREKHAKNSKPKKLRVRQRHDEDTSVATNDDDRDVGERRERPRIVERWIERDYDVPNEDGRDRRRVTVVRRGGGLFENLFGMGGGRDDDDD